VSQNSMDPRRSAEASDWLVRLRDEADDEATVDAWLRWCEIDPANAVAFERVQRVWRALDDVLASDADGGALLQEANPALEEEVPLSRRAASVQRRSAESRFGWRLSAGVALAASLAAAAVMLWAEHRFLEAGERGATEISSTRNIGENRSATLPDGSLIELGAKTSISVDFNYAQRLLLLSPGQAYFKVKPDKKRPFTVQAGPVHVTAVGTAFDVKHQSDTIIVTVQEGIVTVNSPHKAGDESDLTLWRVASGYQFVYSEAGATATLSSVDTSAALAWREGRLEYTRTPLADVVADINRYAMHPIAIDDSSVAKLTFTGTVFTDAIDSWLTALPGALPVQISRSPDGTVRLSGMPNASGKNAAQADSGPPLSH
jgi:transmembrane sensor